MKVGFTVLIIGIFAMMIGFLYRTNGSTFWGRMMRPFRLNRFYYMFMGRRPIRRLLGF